MAKQRTHKKLVNIVNERLSNATNRYGMDFYDIINSEQEFYRGSCPDCLMEIDNYAIRQGNNGTTYVLLFEDKSSNKQRHKAMYQLGREHKNVDLILDKHFISNPTKVRVFEFYVHDHKSPKVEWLTKPVKEYYSLKDELKQMAWAKQTLPVEVFIKASLIFQTDFIDRVSSLSLDHAKDILGLYNKVYFGER